MNAIINELMNNMELCAICFVFMLVALLGIGLYTIRIYKQWKERDNGNDCKYNN